MTTFTAAICTKGRPEVVVGALEALARCEPPPHETIVVDGIQVVDGVTRTLTCTVIHR